MNDRRRGRRVTYRPSRASGVVGIVGGCIFLLIGIRSQYTLLHGSSGRQL